MGASLIPRKSLALSIFGVLERERKRERGGKRGRERERNCDEDVLTTGNLAVLQLEFPFSLLVGFICIDVSSEVVCF